MISPSFSKWYHLLSQLCDITLIIKWYHWVQLVISLSSKVISHNNQGDITPKARWYHILLINSITAPHSIGSNLFVRLLDFSIIVLKYYFNNNNIWNITSALQGSVNFHRGALLLVSQWQCISSFVFYIWSIPWLDQSVINNNLTNIGTSLESCTCTRSPNGVFPK